MQKKEVWKPVVGSLIYKVSNHGRVRSIGRFATNSAGVRKWLKGKILSPRPEAKGHLRVSFSENGKTYNRLIHQVVYESFAGEIPPGYVVHHIDGDPTNNAPSNLCLMEASAHISHHKRGAKASAETRRKQSESRKGRKLTMEQRRAMSESLKGRTFTDEHRANISASARKHPVTQYTIDGDVIAKYPSAREAHFQTGVCYMNICACCRGKRNTAGGFRWEYIKE